MVGDVLVARRAATDVRKEIGILTEIVRGRGRGVKYIHFESAGDASACGAALI